MPSMVQSADVLLFCLVWGFPLRQSCQLSVLFRAVDSCHRVCSILQPADLQFLVLCGPIMKGSLTREQFLHQAVPGSFQVWFLLLSTSRRLSHFVFLDRQSSQQAAVYGMVALS